MAERVPDAAGRDRGFALLLVIWTLALLAVLAASITRDAGSEALMTRNRVEQMHARAIAEAGITLALANLLAPGGPRQWPADGRPRRYSYDGGEATVTVQD